MQRPTRPILHPAAPFLRPFAGAIPAVHRPRSRPAPALRTASLFALLLAAALSLLPGCSSQPPFSEQEFKRFLADTEAIRTAVDRAVETLSGAEHGPDAESGPDAARAALTAREAAKAGWDPARYDYIRQCCAAYGAFFHSGELAGAMRDILSCFGRTDPAGTRDGRYIIRMQERYAAALWQKIEKQMSEAERILIQEHIDEVMRLIRESEIINRLRAM